MAKNRTRKKAPKKAPMITVVEDGEKKRVRTDGSESVPKRISIIRPEDRSSHLGHKGGRPKGDLAGVEGRVSPEEAREILESGDSRAVGQAEFRKSQEGDFTKDVTPAVRAKREAFTAEGVKSSRRRDKLAVEQAIDKKYGKAPDKEDVAEALRTKKINKAEAKGLLTRDQLTPEEFKNVVGTSKPKSMRVSKKAMTAIETAAVPNAGTAPGNAPSGVYMGDGGHGGTMPIGRGSGAPEAEGVRVAGKRRELRSKESIRAHKRHLGNKIPKMTAGNYDPNSAMYLGERPHEQLTRQQRRGMGAGAKFTELLRSGADSGVSYHETTEPGRVDTAPRSIFPPKTSIEDQARYLAGFSKKGYLQPGSITPSPKAPSGNTDKDKLARTAFFGQQARQHAVNTKATSLRQTAISKARTKGFEELGLSKDLKSKDANVRARAMGSEQEAIVRGAQQTGGLYGTGRDIKKAIAVRDRYVRKYGHKLSDEGINNLPGIDREQASELSATAQAEKQAPSVNYYMGQNKAGDTRYNKGLADTKIAEISHHTGHKMSHVRSWLKETGLDVHQVHKDLTEQIYNPAVAKKAWVPTSDPVRTHRMVEFHPSGRIKSRRGRDASGANLPRRFVPIATNPGSDAGTLTHTQYISGLIADHMETKPFRNRGQKETVPHPTAAALTGTLTSSAIPQRQEQSTPFGSSEELIRKNAPVGDKKYK